jgi:hypothetical protein
MLRPILTGVAPVLAGVGLPLLVIEDASATYRRAINLCAQRRRAWTSDDAI